MSNVNGHYIHGGCGTKLYNIWENMKKRCTNPKCERYPNYGGRGILICNEWLNFSNFQKWAFESGYKEGLSIERKDVNGNYEPSNCCWITLKEQALNKTTSLKITYNGKTQNLCTWCEELGLNKRLIGERMRNGLNFEDAITKPVRKTGRMHLVFNGKDYTAKEFAELIGFSSSYVSREVNKGVSLEELFARKGNKRTWQMK